jgi:hypothetical protein
MTQNWHAGKIRFNSTAFPSQSLSLSVLQVLKMALSRQKTGPESPKMVLMLINAVKDEFLKPDHVHMGESIGMFNERMEKVMSMFTQEGKFEVVKGSVQYSERLLVELGKQLRNALYQRQSFWVFVHQLKQRLMLLMGILLFKHFGMLFEILIRIPHQFLTHQQGDVVAVMRLKC